MVKQSLLILAAVLALGSSVPASGAAISKDFNCVPIEVAVLNNRAHVLCAEPQPSYRGGYPMDNGYRIAYFAVSLSDANLSSRFIQVGDIALAAGITIRFSYTSGDYSGEAFGCDRTNCRVPRAFALVKVAWSP